TPPRAPRRCAPCSASRSSPTSCAWPSAPSPAPALACSSPRSRSSRRSPPPSSTCSRTRRGSRGSNPTSRAAPPAPPPTPPASAPDARRLVAALRRRLHEEDPVRSRAAALALEALRRAGAPGTDPGRWYHQQPSSTAPLHGPDDPITLSPSALERAVDCPQSWLMERAGGTRAGGPAQLLGTAIHHLAQIHPRGEVDLLDELHTLLRGMPGTDTWSGRRRVRHDED